MCGIHSHRKLCDFKKKLDITLGAKGIKVYGGRGGSGYTELDDQP